MRAGIALLAQPALVAWILFCAGCHGPAAATTSEKQAADAKVSPTTQASSPSAQTSDAAQPNSQSASTTQPGHIEPYEQTPLFAKIDGYVRKTRQTIGPDGTSNELPLVDIGDSVAEGEVLAELSVPEMEQEWKKAQASLAQASAQVLQAAQAQRVSQMAQKSAEARVAEAQAGLERAEGEFERYKAEFERIRELAQNGSLSQKLVEETRYQYRAAQAAHREALARIQVCQAQLQEAEAQVAQAEADHAVALARQQVSEAALHHIEALLAYRKIVAPFAGVVTQRAVDPGHLVRPPQGNGTRPLFVIARTDRVRVVVEVPEREAARVAKGNRALVRIPALADKEIEAQVSRTAWLLDPVARTLRAEIDLENPQGTIRPGMYAIVTVFLSNGP